MKAFVRKLRSDGYEELGTLSLIRLDGRRSFERQVRDAQFHASARGWPGYVVMNDRFEVIFRKENTEEGEGEWLESLRRGEVSLSRTDQ